MTTEHVLCVPTAVFHAAGRFDGFRENVAAYLPTLLDPANLSYRPRGAVEDDPSYKQLIPYCVFRCGGEVFHYLRGGSGGEKRLHAKRSVGVGGHVSREDGDAGEAAYEAGMRREIAEEVDLDPATPCRLLGLLNDDTDPVGQVHLGLVHVFDLERPQVAPREESIQETGFAPPAELARRAEEFEGWSRIVLAHMAGRGGES